MYCNVYLAAWLVIGIVINHINEVALRLAQLTGMNGRIRLQLPGRENCSI